MLQRRPVCEQTGAWHVGWSVLWRAAGGQGRGQSVWGTRGFCRSLTPTSPSHILLPLPHGSRTCSPSPVWSVWFGRVACSRVKPCPVCLLTVSLFMGQVGCVCWGHRGQGAQEDEPEKPLEEQGQWGCRSLWGCRSQWAPCRLLVAPGSRGEGPPHPRG